MRKEEGEMRERLSETVTERRRNQTSQNYTMLTIVVSTCFLFLSLTLLDVLVIKYLWLPVRINDSLPWFWWAPFWIMQFVFPLALSMLTDSKLPILISYPLFIFGLEDTLFHLIAWNTIPEVYDGIYYLGMFFAPRREIVLIGNTFALILLFAAGTIRRYFGSSKRKKLKEGKQYDNGCNEF